jgi:hypothetical protein
LTCPDVPARRPPGGITRLLVCDSALDAADRDLCATTGDQGQLGCSSVLVHTQMVSGWVAGRHRATSLLPADRALM